MDRTFDTFGEVNLGSVPVQEARELVAMFADGPKPAIIAMLEFRVAQHDAAAHRELAEDLAKL